jgi:hypothetical protein
MPLQKILFKPGVNRENTRYTTEGGWYECDKIRFRQGNPEIIGGWQQISNNTYSGVCRSLWNWVSLDGDNYVGVGTNVKFYIENGGAYNDITPVGSTQALSANPFLSNGVSTITVTANTTGLTVGTYVTFSGVTGTYASTLNAQFEILSVGSISFTISTSPTIIPAVATGGSSVSAQFLLSAGPAAPVPLVGWGAGAWNEAGTTWGLGGTTSSALRLWSQANFGQNLIFGPRGGGIYYWDATTSVTTRAVNLTTLGDAETPVVQNNITVSDISRFVIVLGTNDPNAVNPTAIDPMFIRWSDQEDPFTWIPASTNQAGSIRLSHGSEIITTVQTRQEIVVFTDSAVYSLQYLGPPFVWGAQLLGDGISIISPNAASQASGIVYWMGVDKFYMYDGRIQTLNCDVRRYVFKDLNQQQSLQVFSGVNEGFNEIWWFYCSANSTAIDKYVVYNYLEKIWYYGTMSRTAWLDSGLLSFPIAAVYDTAENTGNIVFHENGLNDNVTGVPAPIESYISSSEFDIGDGHNFGFIWRMLPDLTFENSTSSPSGEAAKITMTLYGLSNSGSGVTETAGDNVSSSASYVITEEFTGQINTRIRGRQMILKIDSNQLNTAWQLGAPRIDIRPDGRR